MPRDLPGELLAEQGATCNHSLHSDESGRTLPRFMQEYGLRGQRR